MDRYQRIEKPREETAIEENEIRVTSQGRMRSYISYAMALFQEKGLDAVVFKAMGRAINKTITIVELIKRRIIGLHQSTSIGSTNITDTWVPLEEGLLTLETTRHVSMISITLSKKELDTSSPGYQAPIPAELVKVSSEFYYEAEGSANVAMSRRGRGRGRSNGYAPFEYDEGWDQDLEYPSYYPAGRGRGRGGGGGRGFRGWGRVQYNNSAPRVELLQDGDYTYDMPHPLPPPRRGRGRGRGGWGRGRGFRYNGPPVRHGPAEVAPA